MAGEWIKHYKAWMKDPANAAFKKNNPVTKWPGKAKETYKSKSASSNAPSKRSAPRRKGSSARPANRSKSSNKIC